MKKKTILLVFSFLFSIITFAQNDISKTEENYINQETQFKLQRDIRIKQDSKEETVIIKIKEQTKKLDLTINSSITTGKLTIEIYNSNGKKQGTFSVGNQLNIDNSEQAQGNITKSLTEPQAGNWKVKIIPVNAKGIVQINTLTID